MADTHMAKGIDDPLVKENSIGDHKVSKEFPVASGNARSSGHVAPFRQRLLLRILAALHIFPVAVTPIPEEHGLPLLKRHLMPADEIVDHILQFVFLIRVPLAMPRFWREN